MSENAAGSREAALAAARQALLRKRIQGAGASASAPRGIPRRPDRTRAPLSFAQERLWFIDQLDPGNASYNVPYPLRITGALDVAALERALGELVRRHEALRTTLRPDETGAPVQHVAPAADFALRVTDLSPVPAAEREAEAMRLVGEEAARPFGLAAGPLFRAELLRLSERDHVLLMTTHHVVGDGQSSHLLARQLAAVYRAFARGLRSPLPEPRVQYGDFAAWQRERLQGPAFEKQLAYWKERLHDAPVLELPADAPRPPVHGHRGASVPLEVPPEVGARIRALALEEGATVFNVFMAALAVHLGRHSGQDDVVVGAPVDNRDRPELEDLAGIFLNTLPIRTSLAGDPSFRETVRRVRAETAAALARQDVQFERLVEELGIERSVSQTPLFQVIFTFAELPEPAAALPAEEPVFRPVPAESGRVSFDLTVAAAMAGERVAGTWMYSADLFAPDTMRRMSRAFEALLARAVAEPDRPLSALTELAGDERRQVVEAWNDTAADHPRDLALAGLFEAQAHRTPDAPAVTLGGDSLTYAALDARADALAARLRALGVTADSRVGLALGRSLEMAVAVLATLKAGGAYVPLDPAYPAGRLAGMLDDAGVAVILTTPEIAARLPEHRAAVVWVGPPHPRPLPHKGGGEHDEADLRPALPQNRGRVASPSEPGGGALPDASPSSAERESKAPLPLAGEGLGRGPSPESLAYVIFTSGSTGRPKAVAMPQRPLLNLLAWQLRSFEGPAAARTLQFASLSFDVSFQEMFSTWASGGTLVLVDEETRTDMAALARLLDRERVERIFLPFVALQHLAEAAEEQGIAPASLREIVTAGEQLRVTEPIRRWLARMPGCALVNQYGPSETHVVSALPLRGDPAEWPALPSIGAPIANTQLYVLDRHLGPAPLGVAGELYLGGENVARGYLGRPELTAERFVPDPFSRAPGARLYRTGDRARWLAGGEVEFLGRSDAQVKVRGFRVEPGEVEAALERHPDVAEAVVLVREDAPGDRRLVGYVVPREGAAAPAAALREHLSGVLPEYMVPAAFVALDALPLTPSGKTDRRALLRLQAPAAETGYVPPRTPTEEAVAGIWTELLGVPRAGAHDDFFALGGHSLVATRVVSRIRGVFGVELGVRALFEAPTVAGLAARVDAARRDEAAAALPPLARAERPATIPLSFAQERLWFLDRLDPGNGAYNMPLLLRLRGRLDADALRGALDALVERHESLRTVFPTRGEHPVQVVRPATGAPFRHEELATVADDAREEAALRRAREEALRPFDLAAGPLFRAVLLRVADDDHVLVLAMHHAVSDGWSQGILARELTALYGALSRGAEPSLPPLPVQYADFTLWQRGWLAGDRLRGEVDFWKERLGGAPALLEVPTDRPRRAARSPLGGAVEVRLPPALLDRVRDLGRREGATPFMTLMAAWQVLLAKYARQDDVVVGTPSAGRTHDALEGLVGFFVNTLAIRTDLSGDPTFAGVVARVRETALDAYAHQAVPFEKLVEELGVRRDLSHAPVFQVFFALQNLPAGGVRLEGLELGPVPLGDETPTKFDLSLVLVEGPDGASGVLEYAADLFDRGTAERMAEHYADLLARLVERPDAPLSSVPLVGPAERARLLAEWNDTARALPGEWVHERIAAQARCAPDAPAVRFGAETVTFGELEQRAGALARRLRRLGVGPDVPVGVAAERGPEMIAAVYGVLKAGGAYVPLDPEYPAERLAWMLGDGAIPVVVATEGAADRLPPHEARVVPVDGGEGKDAGVDEMPSPALDGANLAYVIYTSGSTGRPKGVGVTHAALANHLSVAAEQLALGPGDVTPSLASYAFDFWVLEVLAPLAAGGAVRPVPFADVLETDRVVEVLAECTTVFTVPAQLRQIAETVRAGRGTLPGIRRIIAGGEAVPGDLLAALREAFPAAVTGIIYGPTEATVNVTQYPVDGPLPERIVIGREPVPNCALYVCDPHGEPVPVGVPGELWIGGSQLARGYLGRPELTAEKFIPDPFGGAPGARLYRTGDLVRRLPDGMLEFLGRIDKQVKVRGFRIELGEVEAALARHPALREAVAAVREDTPGDARLVGYAVPAEGAEPAAAEVLRALRSELPEHMVPSALVFLPALPLSPNGKVDTRALPAPGAAPREAYVAPRTALETVLAGVWADVLGVERVGIHDNFFDLGGHSLRATQVAARAKAMRIAIPVRTIFTAPTVEELARAIAAAETRPGETERVAALVLRVRGMAAARPETAAATVDA
jgi:amino acid adenylation domain-containing protein